jgi:hypothetical protein
MSGAETQMLAGYLDGLHDDRAEYPLISNRTQAYLHGWLNGRDDRLRKPRSSAEFLREEAGRVIAEDCEIDLSGFRDLTEERT